MDNLEDAVALFSPRGELIFCNRAMNALHPGAISDLAPDNPIKQIVERTIAGRKSQGPVSITMADSLARAEDAGSEVPEPTERLVMSHAIEDTSGRFLGAMLVARNIGYLSQVHSTLNYSRKLSALGRLMAGVAHEVKNPLNAMTIHLELLKQKLAAVREPIAVPAGAAARPRPVDVSKHVDIIGSEIHRLDEVVNGFLKFARPDELKLQPVHLGALISDVATTAAPEAERRGVTMKMECAHEPAGDQRGSGDAGPGAAEPGAQRVPGDARRRHAEDRVPPDVPGPGRARRRGHRRRDSARSIWAGFSICISRPRKRAAASGCRWSTGSSSCTTAKSKSSPHPGTARSSD